MEPIRSASNPLVKRIRAVAAGRASGFVLLEGDRLLDEAMRQEWEVETGALMVHGSTGSIGCYAMTDARIEEIYTLADAALRNGQWYFRVHCFPFRMTDKKMAKHRDSQWYGFWGNLKEGYDWFEKTGRPPNVEVKDKKYVFEED